MAHKVTLTGMAISSLRQKASYFTFDMEESGSAAVPKGLPSSSTITYTVFVNQKQLKKAGITKENIQTVKMLIQGEPTLDVSVEDCPGEIGVICFQISILPEKQNPSPEPESIKDEPKVVDPTPVSAMDVVKEKPQPIGPDGTEDFIPIQEIIVPDEFLNSYPNQMKTLRVIEFVKKTGYLDEPIMLHPKTKHLTDGYRRYIVAKEMKMDMVPVVYGEKIVHLENESKV